MKALLARLRPLWQVARWALVGLLLVVGAQIGVRIVRELRAFFGTIDGAGDPWMPDPKDPGRILVTPPGAETPESVALPPGVTQDNVRAVAVTPYQTVKVEVLPW